MEFFLGGSDLEMATIRRLLDEQGTTVHDRKLSWGAKASAYEREIRTALAAGRTAVLVELENDLGLPAREWDAPPPAAGAEPALVAVDHHGPRAGADRPTSLHQVFGLLNLPQQRWGRHFDLVAANDRGHVRGMLELRPPATREELVAIRAADRAAQGVTPADEAAAREAVRRRQLRFNGRLTVLHLDSASTSPAADLMEPALGGPGFENLLIVSPGEVNFFGQGSLVLGLAAAFAGGWSGGALPERGFWGSRQAPAAEVIAWVGEQLSGPR